MDLSDRPINQRKFTITEVEDAKSTSKNSTIRITNNDITAKPEKISQRFSKYEFFIGDFQEKNFRVVRQFLTNPETNLQIYYSVFNPDEEVDANLIIVHGWLHSINFFEMAEQFAKQKIRVHLFDLSGFGFSQGVTHNETIDVLITDLCTIVQKVGTCLPVFLYGHSIGALIVPLFLIINPDYPIAGVLMTSPMIDIPAERKINSLKNLFFSKIMSSFCGSIIMNSFMNPTAMTKDNNNVRELCNPRRGVYEFGKYKKH